MAAPASAFVQFYSDALGTDSYLKTEKARDKIVEILATSEPARYFRETLSEGASGIWVKGGRLNLQPYNVVSSAGRIRFGGDRPPRWLDFAFIVNSDVKTNNDAVFRAFLEVNVDVLNLVIDNLDW